MNPARDSFEPVDSPVGSDLTALAVAGGRAFAVGAGGAVLER